MLSFDTAAAIAAAPTIASVDPALRRLLAERVRDWDAAGLLDLTFLLIVDAGDREEAIVEEAGFSPLVNPTDGVRWGSPDFRYHHDWFGQHNGWTELVFTIGNDGWACVMFVQDSPAADQTLLSFFRACASADQKGLISDTCWGLCSFQGG